MTQSDPTPEDRNLPGENDNDAVVLLQPQQPRRQRARLSRKSILTILLALSLCAWLIRTLSDDRPHEPTPESRALEQVMESPRIWRVMGDREEWTRWRRRLFPDMSRRVPMPDENPRAQWVVRAENALLDADQLDGVVHFGQWNFQRKEGLHQGTFTIQIRVYKSVELANVQRDLKIRLANERGQQIRHQDDQTILFTDVAAELFAKRFFVNAQFGEAKNNPSAVQVAEAIYNEILRLREEAATSDRQE